MQHLAGVDIGGTKINVCLGDAQGKIYASKRILTHASKGSKQGLMAAAELLFELLEEQGISLQDLSSIGISAPGPLSTQKGILIHPPNLPGWEQTEIVRFFKGTFQKPVHLNNDANAAALAEFLFGSAKGTNHLVYLTCSTGMGGGAIVNGKLLQGVTDTAAEVGHFVLDPTGPACACGQKGCFEAFCGGASLAHRMQQEIRERKIETQILHFAQGHIDAIDAHCLIQAVQKKDPYALRIWEEFLLRLAQGIGIVLMNFNPEVLLLGTLAIHAGPLLLDPLKTLLPRFAWKENIQACRIQASTLGDKISELSAIAVALQKDF